MVRLNVSNMVKGFVQILYNKKMGGLHLVGPPGAGKSFFMRAISAITNA
jgi:DNA replication protein DnaC